MHCLAWLRHSSLRQIRSSAERALKKRFSFNFVPPWAITASGFRSTRPRTLFGRRGGRSLTVRTRSCRSSEGTFCSMRNGPGNSERKSRGQIQQLRGNAGVLKSSECLGTTRGSRSELERWNFGTRPCGPTSDLATYGRVSREGGTCWTGIGTAPRPALDPPAPRLRRGAAR